MAYNFKSSTNRDINLRDRIKAKKPCSIFNSPLTEPMKKSKNDGISDSKKSEYICVSQLNQLGKDKKPNEILEENFEDNWTQEKCICPKKEESDNQVSETLRNVQPEKDKTSQPIVNELKNLNKCNLQTILIETGKKVKDQVSYEKKRNRNPENKIRCETKSESKIKDIIKAKSEHRINVKSKASDFEFDSDKDFKITYKDDVRIGEQRARGGGSIDQEKKILIKSPGDESSNIAVVRPSGHLPSATTITDDLHGQNELIEEFISQPQVASLLENKKPEWLSKKPLPPGVPAKPTQTPQYGQPSSPATEKTLEPILPSTLPADWGRTEVDEIMAMPTSRKYLEAGRPAKSYDSNSIEEEEVDKLPACACLPGLCKCRGGHYVFSKKWRQHLIRKYSLSAVNEPPVELADPVVYEKYLTTKSSECVCVHSGDELVPHFQTPASGSWNDETSESTETRLRRSDRGGPRFSKGAKNERTLAVIKPQALPFKDVALRAINRAGLDIITERTLKLTAEQVSEIYEQHYESEIYPVLVMSLQGAPILVLALAGLDAVNRWNNLVGPTKVLPTEWFFPNSVVKRFGLHEDMPDSFHASEDLVSAEIENRYFFPDSIIEPIMYSKSEVTDYCGKYVNPTLMKGLAAVIRAKPPDPIVFLAEWLILNNPFQPAFRTNVVFAST